MSLLNNVPFFVFVVLVVPKFILVTSNDNANSNVEISEGEKKGNELLLGAQLAVWELLDNDIARNTIHEFFSDMKIIMESGTSTAILSQITRQVKDTLLDVDDGVVSVKHIADGLHMVLTNKQGSETLEAILGSVAKLSSNTEVVAMLPKMFDLAAAFTTIKRGPEVVTAFLDGSHKLVSSEDMKNTWGKVFSNLRYLIRTSMNYKMKEFLKG